MISEGKPGQQEAVILEFTLNLILKGNTMLSLFFLHAL